MWSPRPPVLPGGQRNDHSNLPKRENPSLRHLGRTHNVCVHWLHERFTKDPCINLSYQPTAGQSADILTKTLDQATWERERPMIGVVPQGRFPLTADCGNTSLPEDPRGPLSTYAKGMKVRMSEKACLGLSVNACFLYARPSVYAGGYQLRSGGSAPGSRCVPPAIPRLWLLPLAPRLTVLSASGLLVCVSFAIH